ncbi:MAG: metallochaperone AztD [Rhizobiaceae bacterium]|nr:metallochaperone AztD [Rhizobiaceae bacterium]
MVSRSVLPALVVAAGAALTPASAEGSGKSVWRLFVGDHAEPVVRVFDAADGDAIGSFSLKSPAALHASASGRTVYAAQRDGNTVQAIATGIEIDDHGDHGDLEITAPALLSVSIEGARPVHVVDHHGQVAFFFDGEGVIRIAGEDDIHDGKPALREVKTPAPHHGVGIAMGEEVLVTIPDPADPSNLPIGIRTLGPDGHPAGEDAPCPGLHGEATSGNLIAIACETGLLIVQDGASGPKIEHLAYAESLPDGKVSTLLGGRGLQYFLGNFGASAVVLIDPEDTGAFRYIELPTRRVHFAVDPVRAKFAYVFTEDGKLHRINVLSGKIANSLELTEPYSMDGHWSDPRPRIAVAGEGIFVTDPLRGVIHAVDAAAFTKAGEIAVGGKPFNIVAIGASGVVHEGEEAKHEHTHGHASDQVYKGYFEDDQIKDRTLADWEGDWQSVYPYLQDGTLDPVMAKKAEGGERTAAEYKAYYEIGYRTDVERITIDGDTLTFYEQGKPLKARYTGDGYEILTYKKGNRGVRFIFRKAEGDADAPQYIQFSDHKIAPGAADHYHLYWGDDRARLLEELTNWPTYYPASLSAEQIVDEMLAH